MNKSLTHQCLSQFINTIYCSSDRYQQANDRTNQISDDDSQFPLYHLDFSLPAKNDSIVLRLQHQSIIKAVDLNWYVNYAFVQICIKFCFNNNNWIVKWYLLTCCWRRPVIINQWYYHREYKWWFNFAMFNGIRITLAYKGNINILDLRLCEICILCTSVKGKYKFIISI